MFYDADDRADAPLKHIFSRIRCKACTGYWYKWAYACFRYKLIPVSGISGRGAYTNFCAYKYK